MMMDHKFYMKLALLEAEKAFNINEVPVGAVIVKDGVVISKAHNRKDSKKSVIKHAEIIAIEKASKRLNNWRLNDCIMYVTLQPCPMCASAIEQSRFKEIVFGAFTDNIKNQEIFGKIFENSSVLVENNILSSECSEIMKKFFDKIR